MATTSDANSAIASPGGAVSREYGSMPVMSPPCHSMIFSRPLARSTCIVICPDKTMNRPSTIPAARRAKDFAYLETAQAPVGCQPLDFRSWNRTGDPVSCQSLDQFVGS